MGKADAFVWHRRTGSRDFTDCMVYKKGDFSDCCQFYQVSALAVSFLSYSAPYSGVLEVLNCVGSFISTLSFILFHPASRADILTISHVIIWIIL